MPTAEQYLKVLRGDALDCLQNLALIDEMERARKNLGISSAPRPQVAICKQIARNAQLVALIAMARLFDRTKKAISLEKAPEYKSLKQPENVSDQLNQIDKGVIKNLLGWRVNFLAHSLHLQTEAKLIEKFPLTPEQIKQVLRICVGVINQYSKLNRAGDSYHQISWDHEVDTLSESVPNMVRGIFNV